jgi:hypothetical protein
MQQVWRIKHTGACTCNRTPHCRSLRHSPHLQDYITEASRERKLHRQKVQDPQQDASRRSSGDFRITTEVAEQVLPVDPSPPSPPAVLQARCAART